MLANRPGKISMQHSEREEDKFWSRTQGQILLTEIAIGSLMSMQHRKTNA